MPKAKRSQDWWCELCLKSGTVELEPREGVWSVVMKIADAHRELDEKCSIRHGVSAIRCQNHAIKLTKQ